MRIEESFLMHWKTQNTSGILETLQLLKPLLVLNEIISSRKNLGLIKQVNKIINKCNSVYHIYLFFYACDQKSSG